MEPSSAPEQPSPEAYQPTYVRPPGLEFAMGMALFAITMLVFFLTQSGVFVAGVVARTPELANGGFGMRTLGEDWFRTRMEQFATNGDVLSSAALWSSIVGLLVIVVSVALWKRRHAALFLGLQAPAPLELLRWLGIFVLLGLGIEALAHFSPAFDTDFMEQVVGSTSQRWLLIAGVGVLAPVFEEFLLRGLLFGSLRHIVDEHTTVAITAGVFALMHLQYNWSIMLLIVPMGVVLGYARSRGASIWAPVALHVLNNVVSIFVP